MERRKFVIGLGSLAAGGAAATGTGAFTSVETDRSMAVDVVADDNALLRLTGDGAENSEYLGNDGSSGKLTIEITDENSSFMGEGLNEDAETTILDVFRIQNQSPNTIVVGTSFEGSGIAGGGNLNEVWEPGTETVQTRVEAEGKSAVLASDAPNFFGGNSAPVLQPGDYIEIGLKFDGTASGSTNDSDGSLSITADEYN